MSIPDWLDLDAIMARVERDARELGDDDPALRHVEQVEYAYAAFGAGNDALDRGSYARARRLLQYAVDAGIEQARCQLDEAIIYDHATTPAAADRRRERTDP